MAAPLVRFLDSGLLGLRWQGGRAQGAGRRRVGCGGDPCQRRRVPPAPDDPSGAPAVAGITKVDDTHAVITRATVDQLLADPMATAKGVRVVPSIQGVPNSQVGLKSVQP